MVPSMVYGLFLAVHVAGGVLALVAASLALFSAKGKAAHVRAGRAFGMGMAAVTVGGLGLLALRPNLFLLCIALFSAWLVATGWRAARLRDGRPRAVDHALTWGMIALGAGMVGWGLWGLVQGHERAVVLAVFGGIGLCSALADLWATRRQVDGQRRIARHMTRMMGGTIAAVTAVLVVNGSALPDVVRWLAPTVVLVPVIVWWNVRLARGRPFTKAPAE